MRILVVTAYLDRPETAIYLGLSKLGITPEVICAEDSYGIDQLEGGGIRVHRMLVRHRLDTKAISFVRRLLGKGGFDLIYAPRNKSLSVSLIASLGRPEKVIGYRGTTGHLDRFDPASWLTYFNPRVSAIVCVSEAVRNYLLEKGLPEDRLFMIHKGHDISWYDFEGKAALDEFGFDSESVKACFVGNIRPVKGVPSLIKAAELTGRKCQFLLVGEIRDRKVQRVVNAGAPPNVRFAGFRSDAARLVGACDIFVLPSLAREGLPRALVEAMAQGVPPVVTGVGGMPEIVEDGVSGLIVKPGNPRELADALITLAHDSNLRRKMGEAAKRRIADVLSIERTISAYADLFRGTAGII